MPTDQFWMKSLSALMYKEMNARVRWINSVALGELQDYPDLRDHTGELDKLLSRPRVGKGVLTYLNGEKERNMKDDHSVTLIQRYVGGV